MPGTWPMLDAGDLESRVRTYLNDVTPDFYTREEIYRWLSIGAKDIAQKTLCIRRVLNARTSAGSRLVSVNAYKVLHVEYIPSSGRPKMLRKIDPLRVGHEPLHGVEPQTWYEHGSSIGIEPLPQAVYVLRLYVADIPKLCHSTFPIIAWGTGWTQETGTGTWTLGNTAAYSGTSAQSRAIKWDTALVAAANYTFTVTVTGLTNCSLVISAGTANSVPITTNGHHTVTLTAANNTDLKLTATMTGASGGLTVDDLYILREGDFTLPTDQTELPTTWQNLLALYATYSGLIKDKRIGAANMLESIYRNEIAYLRQHVVEIIPDGKKSLTYS